MASEIKVGTRINGRLGSLTQVVSVVGFLTDTTSGTCHSTGYQWPLQSTEKHKHRSCCCQEHYVMDWGFLKVRQHHLHQLKC